MKKRLTLFLAGFLLLLSGCAEPLTEPPKLTVTHSETAIEALRGGFSWTVFHGDGTAVSTEADSAHPLQCRDSAPILPLKPSPLSHVDPSAVYLEFETAPDAVYARCWSAESWGMDDAESEDVSAEVTDSAGSPAGTAWVLHLTDEDAIYEVTAEWDAPEQYRGRGTYIFCTKAVTLELHPIEES